jgi:hypothetical protein
LTCLHGSSKRFFIVWDLKIFINEKVKRVGLIFGRSGDRHAQNRGFA